MKHGKSLDYLRKLAQTSTSFRGHRMKWGIVHGRANGPKSQSARCIRCSAEVAIQQAPAPNGVEIGGAAVATQCVPQLPSVSVSYASVNRKGEGGKMTLGSIIANSRVTEEEAKTTEY